MLSTRSLLIRIIIVFMAFIPEVIISGQEEPVINAIIQGQQDPLIDTADYLPLYIDGALDNNLMVAASKGYDAQIELLISKGAHIDSESDNGATPLVFAVANNQLSSVKKLLEYDPDVNWMTSNEETPLIISVRNQNSDIAEILLRNGAEVNLPGGDGATPLHFAVLDGSLNIVDLLLYYDADCNKKSDDGTTPLMTAIWAGFTDISDLLIQNGANLEARDNKGFTPFLIAAQNGDTLMMSLLLKDGVDLYEKNNYNYNALALSIESNRKDAVEYLLKKGDKWTSDNTAVNPYSVASAFGRKEITELLQQKNIPGKVGLRIEEISVTPTFKFNFRDYFTGLSLSFREPLLNAGVIAGCDFNPAYIRILVKEAENTYYQYLNKSTVLYAGLFKDFMISEYGSGMKLSFSTSLCGGYSFGTKFKGTNTTIEGRFRFIPSAGFKLQKQHFSAKAEIQYMKTDFYQVGPIWIGLGISYNYFLSRVRSPGKTINWY